MVLDIFAFNSFFIAEKVLYIAYIYNNLFHFLLMETWAISSLGVL